MVNFWFQIAFTVNINLQYLKRNLVNENYKKKKLISSLFGLKIPLIITIRENKSTVTKNKFNHLVPYQEKINSSPFLLQNFRIIIIVEYNYAIEEKNSWLVS